MTTSNNEWEKKHECNVYSPYQKIGICGKMMQFQCDCLGYHGYRGTIGLDCVSSVCEIIPLLVMFSFLSQVLKGDIKPAIETHEMLYQIIQRHSFLPEVTMATVMS